MSANNGAPEENRDEECKRTVAEYERMMADYNMQIDIAEKEQKMLKDVIADLENRLKTTSMVGRESNEKIRDLEKKLRELEIADRQLKDLKDRLSRMQKDYETARRKLDEMEHKYRTANDRYNNSQRMLKDIDTKYRDTQNNYRKLNDRINRLKRECTGEDPTKCNTSKVHKILQEKFTSKDMSCGSTIMYCIIALILGILIGSWLFGDHKRTAYRETVRNEIIEPEPINEIEYKPEP